MSDPRPATPLEQLQTHEPTAQISQDKYVREYVDKLEELAKRLELENTLRRRTLEAIVECRCRFRVDPLEHAREAVQHCRDLARAGLELEGERLEELGA